MLLFALAGCMGTFHTEVGPDPVRGALFFHPDATLSLAVSGARQAFVLLTNSTLPCAPPDVENDPRTVTDEVAQSQEYWQWQLASAFSREGALAVAAVLAVDPTDDWIGRYDLHADAWDADAMGGYVVTDGRVAAGAWYTVNEAAVESNAGVNPVNEVTDDDFDDEVGAPAWIEVTGADDVLSGDFNFAPTNLSGHFEAQLCDNLDLLALLYLQLASLSVANGAEIPNTSAVE